MSGIESVDDDQLEVVQAEITIKLGIDERGKRGIFCSFVDKMEEPDEDGDSQIIQYFDGRMMIAIAEDQFKMQHGFLLEPSDEDDI